MGSEDQVLQLMALLDTGLQQALSIEEKLDEYENRLQVKRPPFFQLARSFSVSLYSLPVSEKLVTRHVKGYLTLDAREALIGTIYKTCGKPFKAPT